MLDFILIYLAISAAALAALMLLIRMAQDEQELWGRCIDDDDADDHALGDIPAAPADANLPALLRRQAD